MNNKRIEEFDHIVKSGKEGYRALSQYWYDYSLFTSLEYWLMVSFLVVPLILLFFMIDKKKLFFLGFYGYSVHVFFSHVDEFATNAGLLGYPFPVIPALPGLSLESSLVPVTFMLVYQWTLNQNKNYYIFITLTAGMLAFGFKPLLVSMGLFKLYGQTNYFHLFIAYMFIVFLAKFITNVFIWTEKYFLKNNRNQ